MVDFKPWGDKEKLVLVAFFLLCVLNLVVGLLALGPDLLRW